ncbi:hypothetical protein ACIBQX_13375 [Nonomuraea sp. NPDC049714]|uniref:hypothetical protein n=1 Tax=Nonomuraea sp. NPDC049714 TaxID=3364357 RepID=UPI0037B88CB7
MIKAEAGLFCLLLEPIATSGSPWNGFTALPDLKGVSSDRGFRVSGEQVWTIASQLDDRERHPPAHPTMGPQRYWPIVGERDRTFATFAALDGGL